MDKLAEFIAPRRGKFMMWGVNDCCLTMSDWVLLRRGVDPMAHLRGTYRGWKQAARLWRSLGGVEAAVIQALDPVLARTKIAHRGDIALVQTHNHACTAAIVDYAGVWLPTQKGYALAPFARVKIIWEI